MGLRIQRQRARPTHTRPSPGPCCSCRGEFVLLTMPTRLGSVLSPPVGLPGVTFLIKEQLPHPSCPELDRVAWDSSDLSEDGGFKRRSVVSNRCF